MVHIPTVVVGEFPSNFVEFVIVRPFAELSAKEKCVEVVRWLCVVPAAWLAGMLPRFIYAIVRPPALAQLPGTPRPPVSDLQRIYLPHLLGIVMAAAFVIVGAKLAPRWRLPAAAVLAVLWMVFSYGIHVWPHASFALRYLSQFMVASVSALAATAYIWYSETRKQD
jgi:hypothetical protein